MQSVMSIATVPAERKLLPARDDAIGWLEDYGSCFAGHLGGTWRIVAAAAPGSGLQTWEHWRTVRTNLG